MRRPYGGIVSEGSADTCIVGLTGAAIRVAHEETDAAAGYLLISKPAFASKLAPTGGICGSDECAYVGVSLLTKRLMQPLSNLLINQSAFASKLPRGHLWER